MSDISKVFIGCYEYAYITEESTLYIDDKDGLHANLLDSLEDSLKYIKYREIVHVCYGIIIGITLDGDAMEIIFDADRDGKRYIDKYDKINLPKKIKSVTCIYDTTYNDYEPHNLITCPLIWLFEDSTIQLNNLESIVDLSLLNTITTVKSIYSINTEESPIILCLLDDNTIKCISCEWLSKIDTVRFSVQTSFENVKEVRVLESIIFIEYLNCTFRAYDIYLTEDITQVLTTSNRLPNNISIVLQRANLLKIYRLGDNYIFYFDDGSLLYKDDEIKCSIVFRYFENIIYKRGDIWGEISDKIQKNHIDNSFYDKILYDTVFLFIGHLGEVYKYNYENSTLTLVDVPRVLTPNHFVGI